MPFIAMRDIQMYYEIYGNKVIDWAYAFTASMMTFAVLFFLRWILIRRLKHWDEPNKATFANGFITSIKRNSSR